MLKQLLKEIEQLGIAEDKHGEFSAVVSRFKRSIFNWRPKRIDSPIYEVRIDKIDPELCLITGYLSSEELSQKTPLLFRDLLHEFKNLETVCADYEVLSSAWAELSDQYNGRIDRPITKVVLVTAERKVILVHN